MAYLSNVELVCLVTAFVASGCIAAGSQILTNFENLLIGVINKATDKYGTVSGYEVCDLLQELNLQVLAKLKKYDADRGAVCTYVQIVAQSTIGKLYKKTEHDKDIVSLDKQNDDEESIWTNKLVAENNTEQEALKPIYLQMFVQDCQNYTRDDVDRAILQGIMDAKSDLQLAQELNLHRVTVCNRRNKLLVRLRNNLQQSEIYA